MGRKRKYNTEEEIKAAKKEKNRRYYQKNKEKRAEYYQRNREKFLEYGAEYYQDNKKKIAEHKAEYRKSNKKKLAEQLAEYRSSKYGRALHLLDGYRQSDSKNNKGECTLTAEWIVDNIFSGQVCHYCGENDWMKLGCDRKDSSLPHTPENCVPCCHPCNRKKSTTPYDLYMKMIGKIA